MPRIRSIKPEFWDSEDVAAASLRARLLYIAMWNWADDYGIGDATPIRLLGFAFPHDDVAVSEVPTLCEEISERFGVVFYKHQGRAYFYIPSWEEHQRTEKKAKQRVPFPHDLENPAIPGFLKTAADSPTPSGGSSDAGKGKEERGTGEEGTLLPDKSGDAQPDTPDRFDEFWDTYGYKEGRKRAQAAWRTALKKRGVTADLLIAAAAGYIAWQKAEGKFPEFTKHPTTWLNGEHWNDERPARAAPMSNVEQHLALVRQLGDGPDEPKQIGQGR